MADKFKLSRKAKKIILGACIGGVVVLTAGLFTYIHISDTNTLGRKISIYGVDVSTLTTDKAEQKLLDAFRSRKVQFKEGGSDVYQTTVSELGYDLDESALKSELTELQTTREANRKILPRRKITRSHIRSRRMKNRKRKLLRLLILEIKSVRHPLMQRFSMMNSRSSLFWSMMCREMKLMRPDFKAM